MTTAKIPTERNLESAYIIVADYLAEKYGPKSINVEQVRTITHAAFKHLKNKESSKIGKWKKGRVPSNEEKKSLLTAVKDILLNAKSPWNPKLELDSKIQQLFFKIMRGKIPPTKELLQGSLLKAVIWKKNPQLLKEGRDLLNKIFADMSIELSQNKLSKEEIFHMEMIIGDLLSLYPFLDPKNEEELKVPLHIEGKWKVGTYHVEKIKLTPNWMGSPLVAIGLKPQDAQHIPPLLLFKGTTYPTDKGFSLSLLTDLNPGASVGSYAFSTGRKKIQGWLNRHAIGHKAIVYGKSLGGAQAWRTALHYPDQIQKVMAYGAPGFSSKDEKKWELIINKRPYPKVNMFCQQGDPVPYFDKVVPKGFNYFLVLGEKSRHGVLAHADMYSTHERSVVINIDASKMEKKWRRMSLTALRAVLSIFVFPVRILSHSFQTSLKKTLRLATRHKVKKIQLP